MSLVQLREEGWFDKPEKIVLDLNPENVGKLKNRQPVEISEKGGSRVFAVHVRSGASQDRFTSADLVLEEVSRK